MLEATWAFLQDEANRTVLAWIGGGVVVIAGGLWGVVKYRSERKTEKPAGPPPPSVSASHGGVAAGRDITNSKVNTRGDAKS